MWEPLPDSWPQKKKADGNKVERGGVMFAVFWELNPSILPVPQPALWGVQYSVLVL